jgi:hypothetical protein
MLKKIVAVASLLLLSGCGGGDSAPPVVDGKWAAPTVIVGSSMAMSLASQQSSVTGTGTYAAEAGASGTFTVSGTYQPPRLSLVLQYDNGHTGSYSATLSDASHMNGTITSSGGSASPLEFVKR